MPLVLEAAMKSVSAFTSSGLPNSRTPRPPSKTTRPLSRSASEAPGMSSFFIEASTKLFSSAMLSEVRGAPSGLRRFLYCSLWVAGSGESVRIVSRAFQR